MGAAAPLLVLIAEGPERGVQAELVDDELTAPGSIARVSWPGLNGRAGGLQLTVDKVTLPENLQGLELPEVLTATSGGDWSALDLGACYRKARARLRARDVAVAEKGRAYTSYEDVMQALEVAEPIMALRGFPGSGLHTLPFALEQVAQSWKLYGGEGCSPTLQKRLAEEGREFILAILRRFGQVRHAFIAGTNPESPRYCTETPVAARRRLECTR